MGPFVAIVMTYFVVLAAATIGTGMAFSAMGALAVLVIGSCLIAAWFLSSRLEKREEGEETGADDDLHSYTEQEQH